MRWVFTWNVSQLSGRVEKILEPCFTFVDTWFLFRSFTLCSFALSLLFTLYSLQPSAIEVINLIFQIACKQRHQDDGRWSASPSSFSLSSSSYINRNAPWLQFPFITQLSRLSGTQNPDKLAAELGSGSGSELKRRHCKRQSCRRRQTLIGLPWALTYVWGMARNYKELRFWLTIYGGACQREKKKNNKKNSNNTHNTS